MTHFLASARKVERGVGERSALVRPADGAAAGLRGRVASEPRVMASEGPRESAGEVRTAAPGSPEVWGPRDAGRAASPQPRRPRRPRLTGVRRDAVGESAKFPGRPRREERAGAGSDGRGAGESSRSRSQRGRSLEPGIEWLSDRWHAALKNCQ